MQNTAQNEEMDWNGMLTEDAEEYVLLPAGDYDFTVDSFDRGRHGGSEKLPPCSKAVLKIRICTPQGTAVLTHNLFLHRSVERLLSAFFESIGQKKKGVPLQMNWQMVPGSTGRLKLGTREYNGNTYNEIKRFYPKEAPKYQAGSF